MVEGMGKELLIIWFEMAISVVAMVLIYLIVRQHIGMGGQGLGMIGGIAAIAGLGGYELRSVLDALRRRRDNKNKAKV